MLVVLSIMFHFTRSFLFMLNIFSIKDKDKNNIVLGLLEHIKVRDERIAVLEAEVARRKKLPQKKSKKTYKKH